MNQPIGYELAKERAAKDGFDVVTFEREYEGGNLFLALKSKYMHKYAGHPMLILVKENKVTVMSDNFAWSYMCPNY